MALKFMLPFVLVMMAALSNCAVAESPAAAGGEPDPVKACTARGGSWQKTGRAGLPACVAAYADAGKACRSGKDCAGDCRIGSGAASMQNSPNKKISGACQADDTPFGCYATVENGKIDRPMMCVD
jgi:hypothetical protein